MNASTPSGTRTREIFRPLASFHFSATLPTGSGKPAMMPNPSAMATIFFSFSSSLFVTDLGSEEDAAKSALFAPSMEDAFLTRASFAAKRARFFVSAGSAASSAAAFFAAMHFSSTSPIALTLAKQYQVFPLNDFIRPSEKLLYFPAFLACYGGQL